MRRRIFLASIGAAGVGSVSGCAGLINPDMEFQSFMVPDPTGVSAEAHDNSYSAIIHNRGDSGGIRLELWRFKNSNTPNPDAASIYELDAIEQLDRKFDRAVTTFFSSGERREVTIASETEPPQVWDSPEFGILPWPASHGAVFKNTGRAGNIEFKFKYIDTRGYSVSTPPPQVESVGSDKTIEIVFDTVIPPRAEYEIVAEPR